MFIIKMQHHNGLIQYYRNFATRPQAHKPDLAMVFINRQEAEEKAAEIMENADAFDASGHPIETEVVLKEQC